MEELNELNKLYDELYKTVKQAKKYGIKKAEAEYDYKVVLRQESLKLRLKEMPVTMIDKVVYGEEEVAKKRKERDIAESDYHVELELINILKKRANLLETLIKLDFGGRND